MNEWSRWTVQMLEGDIGDIIDIDGNDLQKVPQISPKDPEAKVLRFLLVDDVYGKNEGKVREFMEQNLSDNTGKPFIGDEWQVEILALPSFAVGSELIEQIGQTNNAGNPMFDVDGLLLDVMNDATKDLEGLMFEKTFRDLSAAPGVGVLYVTQIAKNNDEAGRHIRRLAEQYGNVFAVPKSDTRGRPNKDERQQLEGFFDYVATCRRYMMEPWAIEYGKWVGIDSRADIHRVLGLFRNDEARRIPLVVLGESGTGKELVARLIHAMERVGNMPDTYKKRISKSIEEYEQLKKSTEEKFHKHLPMPLMPPKKYEDWFQTFKPFMAQGHSSGLIHSALFGHGIGAYTDASWPREGLIKQAQFGTLFVDELGDLPLSVQGSLLRYMQEGEILPMGSDVPLYPQDVRKVFATHADPAQLCREGKMRPDFLNRIDGMTLRLKSLKERSPADCYDLVDHFVRKSGNNHLPVNEAIHPDTAERIVGLCGDGAFEWNVRQLESFVTRMMLLTPEGKAAGEAEFDAACEFAMVPPHTSLKVEGADIKSDPELGKRTWNDFVGLSRDQQMDIMRRCKAAKRKPRAVVSALVSRHEEAGGTLDSLLNFQGKPLGGKGGDMNHKAVLDKLSNLYSKNMSEWLE